MQNWWILLIHAELVAIYDEAVTFLTVGQVYRNVPWLMNVSWGALTAIILSAVMLEGSIRRNSKPQLHGEFLVFFFKSRFKSQP